MKQLKVLIACEESQRVCIEFRKLGHEAYSADIQEPSGGHPEWHVKGDVLQILNPEEMFWIDMFVHQIVFQTMNGEIHVIGKWDLIIAHPPCTYLSNAGARWLYKDIGGKTYIERERFEKGMDGKEFFMRFLEAECQHIAVENPIPSAVYRMPPYTQVVQPFEYGHPYSKKTCLWLKGLPKLKPTALIKEYKPYCTSGSYTKTHDARYKGASRRGGSAKSRSKTFQGIAQAMAQQWSAYLTGQTDKQLSFFEEE
jgi:hypothetical protein